MNVGRSSSCIGENVTYICNVTSNSHIWDVDGVINGRTLVSGNIHPITEEGFIFRVESRDGKNNIISSLLLYSTAKLNGTNITCRDGIPLIMVKQIAEVAMVLGKCYKNFYITIIIAGCVVSVECLTSSSKMSP